MGRWPGIGVCCSCETLLASLSTTYPFTIFFCDSPLFIAPPSHLLTSTPFCLAPSSSLSLSIQSAPPLPYYLVYTLSPRLSISIARPLFPLPSRSSIHTPPQSAYLSLGHFTYPFVHSPSIIYILLPTRPARLLLC